jgi:hypothetical protein
MQRYQNGCTRGQMGPVPGCGGRVRDRPAPNDKNRALDALEVSRFTGKSDREPSSPDFLTSAAGDAYDVRPQVHLQSTYIFAM